MFKTNPQRLERTVVSFPIQNGGSFQFVTLVSTRGYIPIFAEGFPTSLEESFSRLTNTYLFK